MLVLVFKAQANSYLHFKLNLNAFWELAKAILLSVNVQIFSVLAVTTCSSFKHTKAAIVTVTTKQWCFIDKIVCRFKNGLRKEVRALCQQMINIMSTR